MLLIYKLLWTFVIEIGFRMFSFRSDSVEDHMKNVITEILSRDELTDVTLVCDDQVGFRAHKVVLAGGSKLFQQIFQVNTTAPLVRVEGMGERELLWIIQYLYYGEVSLDKSDQITFHSSLMPNSTIFICTVILCECFIVLYMRIIDSSLCNAILGYQPATATAT